MKQEDDPRATEMYARHGSFEAQPGKGQLLASLLLEAAELLRDNADCRSYLVSRSTEKSDEVWVYEVWTSKEAHVASLQDERVMDLIGRARPLIAGASKALELVPVGGKGAI